MADDIFAPTSVDDEIQKALYDPSLDAKTRDLYSELGNERETARSVGVDPSEGEPRESLLWKVLDTLSIPLNATAGIIDTAVNRGDMFTGDVGLGAERGIKEKTTTADILRRAGVDNPIVRGLGGFAGDVVLDPLMWLTLGTGEAATAGGRALTEAGDVLKNELRTTLSKQGEFALDHIPQAIETAAQTNPDSLPALMGAANTAATLADPIKVDGAVNDIFSALHSYQEGAKGLASESDAVAQASLQQMNAAQESVKRFGVDLAQYVDHDTFAKPALDIGLNVPFLGHITGAAPKETTELVLNDSGPVGQAFKVLGKVWKPGKINVAHFEMNDDVLNAFDNIRLWGNEKLGQLADTLVKLPMGSTIVEAGKKVGSALQVANDAFLRTFYQKALIGADANNNRIAFIDAQHAAGELGKQAAVKVIGDEALQNPALMRAAYLQIDSLAMSAAQQGAKSFAAEQSAQLLDLVNRAKAAGGLPDLDIQAFSKILNQAQIDTYFNAGMKAFMSAPEAEPGLKSLVGRIVDHFDQLAKTEQEAGLNTGFVANYVPHRYVQLAAKEAENTGTLQSFLKGRKYSTIEEAFNDGAKVADISLPDIVASRTRGSLVMQAQRQYALRTMMQEGLDPLTVQKLYLEAAQNPSGDAARLLMRKGIDVNPEMLSRNIDTMVLGERQAAESAARRKWVDETGSPEAAAEIARATQAYTEKIDREMWLAGKKPLDNLLPNGLLGEVATKVTIPGKEVLFNGKLTDSMYLPAEVARAFKETVAYRDMIKDAVKGSPFGEALLGAMDHATNFFKRAVTIPFPQYWTQNWLGDRFRQAMEGAHAMDPGLFQRAYAVMSGQSAIRNKAGMILDKPTLERVIKTFGMQFGSHDYLGTVRNFADMDVGKYLASKRGILSNLKDGEKAMALQQAGGQFENLFDGFNRVTHFIHRFEMGDTIPDAVRSANEVYYNYRDLSPVERSVFRRFYMFYGFTSKTTKRLLTDLVSAPGKVTLQLRGTRAIAEAFSDPSATPTVDEFDYHLLSNASQQEEISHVIGKGPDGRAIVAKGLGAPLNSVLKSFALEAPRNLSVGEILSAAGDSATRTIQKQFAMANPVINAIAQRVTGKNLYFDKPLNSEFLRKLPSLNSAAESLAGYKHDELPIDLDAPVKEFLDAVPDGKGHLIANPGKFWVLMNLVPAFGSMIGGPVGTAAAAFPRANSIINTLTNTSVTSGGKLLRGTLGINVDDEDLSRSYLGQQKQSLEELMQDESVRQRVKNQRDEFDD